MCIPPLLLLPFPRYKPSLCTQACVPSLSLACVPRYSLALRLNHWFHVYDHWPGHSDLATRLSYLLSTGLLASLDLLVWAALALDSVTFLTNGLLHNDPFSELHKHIAWAIYRPAVLLYTQAAHLLERFGSDDDQWTAVLLVSQVPSYSNHSNTENHSNRENHANRQKRSTRENRSNRESLHR